jgi:hypothetical protein
MCKALVVGAVLLCLTGTDAVAQSEAPGLRPGAKIFVSPMPDDFNSFLKAAFAKKKVPLTIVESRDSAEFEITGSSETQKASTAKKVFRLSFRSDEQASISIADIASGEVVFAYSVNKRDSAHGKRSTAEACAKHIKKALENVEAKKPS